MTHFRLKGTSGSVINRTFPFADTLVIGAAQDCDVRVEEPGVALRQAEIRRDGDGLRLIDLAGNGATVLNGASAKEQRLNTGDEIRIGTCRWLLQAPGLRPQRVLTPAVVESAGIDRARVLAWTLAAVVAVMVAVLRFRPEWLLALL
jgi:hypothetical protein